MQIFAHIVPNFDKYSDIYFLQTKLVNFTEIWVCKQKFKVLFVQTQITLLV